MGQLALVLDFSLPTTPTFPKKELSICLKISKPHTHTQMKTVY